MCFMLLKIYIIRQTVENLDYFDSADNAIPHVTPHITNKATSQAYDEIQDM